MEKYIRFSIIGTILLFVALAILASFTDAITVIKEANLLFVALASVFFILSIVFWIIPWAYLIKKTKKLSLSQSIILGYSCVYGALTPMQLGTEALRSIKAKKFFKVSYSESVSAAMVVKGIKFLLLVLIATIIILDVLLTTKVSLLMFVALITGFVVIVLAALLFLLPLNKKIGLKIARLFGKISKKISIFSKLEEYFEIYADYLTHISKKKFGIAFVWSALSFALEFLALYFCFLALNVFIELSALLFLFILVSVLERTPFLPRGIGLVEAVGFIFLSIPNISFVALTIPQIAAILILFDVVRLIIPTLTSLGIALIPLEKLC